MILTTYKNHYRFGYDDINNFQFRENEYQRYTVEFGRANYIHSFKQESINAAKQIHSDANGRPIFISYSGGVDSEYIVYTFLEAKIPFEIITARFKKNLNEYDFNYVKKSCDRNHLKLNIINIDIEKFLEVEMIDYANATQCCSPQFPMHMYLWDAFDGFIVAGHNLTFRRNPSLEQFHFTIGEKNDSVFRYYIWRNRDGCPSFNIYTPELVLSFMLENEISKLFAFGKAFKVASSRKQKTILYRNCYDIEEREKQTGFEHIMELDKKYRDKLENLYSNDSCQISLRKLIEQLSPKYYLENKIIPRIINEQNLYAHWNII